MENVTTLKVRHNRTVFGTVRPTLYQNGKVWAQIGNFHSQASIMVYACYPLQLSRNICNLRNPPRRVRRNPFGDLSRKCGSISLR
jgi:hypothetical protein